jgi:hypothetical protein
VLRAVIVDRASSSRCFKPSRTIEIVGCLEPDDDSILLILSEWAYKTPRQVVLSLSGLTLSGIDGDDEHHASNLVLMAIGQRALRGQWIDCCGFPARLHFRLNELFAAWDLQAPVCY